MLLFPKSTILEQLLKIEKLHVESKKIQFVWIWDKLFTKRQNLNQNFSHASVLCLLFLTRDVFSINEVHHTTGRNLPVLIITISYEFEFIAQKNWISIFMEL